MVRRQKMRCLFIVLSALIGALGSPAQTTLTVSAAASLKDALVEAEAAYKQSSTDISFANNFGSSGTLAAQIDQGAPVDIFISAAAKPMDELQANSLLVPSTRHNLLSNTLVLIAPLDSKLRDFQGLTGGSVRVIALGDPASVPAGQYGKQTLVALHLFDAISAKLVLAKDVRQVLAYVETGNADAGLVYATDAQSSGKVRVVAVAPESAHDPIIYPEAAIKGSRNVTAALKFIEYLRTPAAQAIFVKHGFTISAR
jgi:molybdate transport system substrate-binding protein